MFELSKSPPNFYWFFGQKKKEEKWRITFQEKKEKK